MFPLRHRPKPVITTKNGRVRRSTRPVDRLHACLLEHGPLMSRQLSTLTGMEVRKIAHLARIIARPERVRGQTRWHLKEAPTNAE